MTRQLDMDTFLELDFRLEAIEGQRNRALADHAVAIGKLRIAEHRLEVEKKRAAELERDVEALKKERDALKELLAQPGMQEA